MCNVPASAAAAFTFFSLSDKAMDTESALKRTAHQLAENVLARAAKAHGGLHIQRNQLRPVVVAVCCLVLPVYVGVQVLRALP